MLSTDIMIKICQDVYQRIYLTGHFQPNTPLHRCIQSRQKLSRLQSFIRADEGPSNST